MRSQILAGIRALDLGTFSVSQELPWDASGQNLWIKNPKVFYVSDADREQTALLNTLCGGSGIRQQISTVRVYVTCDAKQKPTNFDSLINGVQDLVDLPTITGVYTRECDVVTTFEADRMVTEFEFRFTELVKK